MDCTILIVDDNRVNVLMLQKQLASHGYHSLEAYDGDQAIELAKEKNPDLILLDVVMPEPDGFSVCEILKKDQSTKDIPIILVTAKGAIPDKIKGLDLGVDDYITKPFDNEELFARIASLLKTKAIHRKDIEAEKIKTFEKIVEGVAHEVRNPLVSIGGFARRIYEGLDDDDNKKEYEKIILAETERLENMVKDISKLNLLISVDKGREDVHFLIREALHEVRKDLEDHKIRVTKEFSDLPMVTANRQNMINAIVQLIRNAIEAMKQGGKLRISTSKAEEPSIVVEIKDDGRGISEKDIDRIFEPFFTSKTSGAGMGLALALKIIEDHAGSIEIKSEKGVWTKAVIKLPCEELRNDLG